MIDFAIEKDFHSKKIPETCAPRTHRTHPKFLPSLWNANTKAYFPMSPPFCRSSIGIATSNNLFAVWGISSTNLYGCCFPDVPAEIGCNLKLPNTIKTDLRQETADHHGEWCLIRETGKAILSLPDPFRSPRGNNPGLRMRFAPEQEEIR
jgi:hypothetical protein